MKDFSWIGWLLVVLGWGFVNYTNNRRETRKEARAAVDQAKKEVLSVAKTAISYFGDPASTSEDEIKNSLELLEVELERLNDYSRSQLMNRFGEFHEQCTGADFESSSRVAHGKDSAVVQGIVFSRNRLVQELERHFRRHYSASVL